MRTHDTPELACLFWFYKSPELCENRLRLLRKHNPHIPIYGLYGGELRLADEFKKRLSTYLDDFYIFSQDRPPHWKWYHGDQMIVDWFRQRGQHLKWDTLFIAQWDMLVFGSLKNLFSSLKKDEILLSGLRPVHEVDPWWYYIRQGSEEKKEYDEFIRHMRETYSFDQNPLCCEFIVACLPRNFLNQYQDIVKPELGFLEYKIPIYAQLFRVPLRKEHPYQPWWGDAPNAKQVSIFSRGLNSETTNVPLRVIEAHRIWPWGRRIFHPVFEGYPEKSAARIKKVLHEVLNDEFKLRWWKWHHARQKKRLANKRKLG